MIRLSFRLYAGICLAGVLIGMTAMSASTATGQAAQQPLQDAASHVAQLQSDLDLATKKLERTKSLYESGHTAISEVENAQAQVQGLTRELQGAKAQQKAMNDRAAFMRSVDIHLDHATVRLLATALSKATGIPVKVDADVPADSSTTLTLDAKAVPFANALEAIAEKADLMIAPDGSGVVLKKWPHLNNRVLRSPIAPWSSDWQVPPTMTAGGFGGPGRIPAGLFGGGQGANNVGPGDFPGGQVPQAGGATGFNPFVGGQIPGQGAPNAFDPNSQQGGPGGFPGRPQPGQPGFDPNQQPGFRGPGGMAPNMGMGGMPFTVTGLGEKMIAISEPGMSDAGEPGVWMTAYLFDGTNFRRMGRGFHPFTMGPRNMPGGPGQPGQFGPGGPGRGIPPNNRGGVSGQIPSGPGPVPPRTGARPPGAENGRLGAPPTVRPGQGELAPVAGAGGQPVEPSAGESNGRGNRLSVGR